MNNKNFAISLGGSVICPEEIDVQLLQKFYRFIKREVKNGSKFIIVAGGGNIAREYQKAAFRIIKASVKDRDWLGIQATKINALLLKSIFKKKPILFYLTNVLK